MLNLDYIFKNLTNNTFTDIDSKGNVVERQTPVPYRWTHGATDYHLGDALLIYSIIQFMRAKVCVCLGSGGGFIPRVMTQARIDLYNQGIFEGDNDYNWGDIGTTFIVDAANGVGGNVDWLEQESFLRKNFYPRIIVDTTENAFYNFFVKEDIKIDYLHIDAGHSFEDVKRDFELYKNLLSNSGIISIHDTDESYEKDYIVTKDISDQNHHQDFANGPAKLIDILKEDKEWEMFNFFNNRVYPSKPSSTGITLLQRA